MPATFALAFAWNPVVGVPMLIVGVIALALIWLFGQPRKEQGKRRVEPGAAKGVRREPVLGEQPVEQEPSVDLGREPVLPAGFETVAGQGELDVGLREELERLGAALSGDHSSAAASGPAPARVPVPTPVPASPAPAPKTQPKLADHVASIISALRAPPDADAAPAAETMAGTASAPVAHAPSAAAPAAAAPPQSEVGRRPAQVPVERIVTLFVVAREGALFNGADLVVAADKAGLEYGDMGIYHRLVDGKREMGPIFSVANMLKPGSFNLADLDALRTPGVSFFMTLPGPLPALDAWDAMLPTAQRLAELLDGLVLDEERNALGRQCVAHIRDQLRTWDRDHEG